MGKRYYCDYCDCFTPESIGARKTHMRSFKHQQNVRAYHSYIKEHPPVFKPKRVKSAYEKLAAMDVSQVPPSLRPPIGEYQPPFAEWGYPLPLNG